MMDGWKKDLKDAQVEELDSWNSIFSAIKRVFGEDLLSSKKFSAQKIEAGLKIMPYNTYTWHYCKHKQKPDQTGA